MKASLHMGRGSAKHNDRTFDISRAEHIDPDKQNENKYLFRESDGRTFEEAERHYYESHFSDSLEATNSRYIQSRHPEKCRTMESWYEKTYPPTEAILQVGQKDDQPPPKVLLEAYSRTMHEVQKRYPALHILTAAYHADEATPHIHLRFVIEGHDKAGHLKPLKAQGLREMGVPLPDPEKAESRYNNRMMTLTSDMRNLFYEQIRAVCTEKDIAITLDTEPRLDQKHLDTLHFKKHELASEIEALSQQKADAEAELMAEEKTIAARAEALATQEAALHGRTLQLEELQALAGKPIWSREDKSAIISTALEAARSAKKAAKASKGMVSAQSQLKAAKSRIKALTAEVTELKDQLSFKSQLSRQALQGRIESLERQLERANACLQEHGLLQAYREATTHTHHR